MGAVCADLTLSVLWGNLAGYSLEVFLLLSILLTVLKQICDKAAYFTLKYVLGNCPY